MFQFFDRLVITCVTLKFITPNKRWVLYRGSDAWNNFKCFSVLTLSGFCVPDIHCENTGLVSGKTCKLVDKPSRAIFALATIVGRTPTPKWISLERKLNKRTHLRHLENPTPPLPLRYLCETPYIAVKSFAWARHKLVSYKSMLVREILR